MKTTAKAVEVITELCDYLAETHHEEIKTNHHGDGSKGCTYCAAIKAGRDLLPKMLLELAGNGGAGGATQEYDMCLNPTKRGMIIVAGKDELEASRRALEILGYFLRKRKATR